MPTPTTTAATASPATDATDAATVAASYESLTKHAKTFRLASHFLPRARRDDAAVVYAFCRLVDDIADESPDDDTARAGLDDVRAELRGDREPRPLVATFRRVAERCAMPLEAADELITGVRGDLGPVRLADDRELMRYCYRVAGTVGLLMCGVLGVTDPAAHPFAVDLGVGMQLTNIGRDVREDADRDRVYLPATRLRDEGLDSGDLLAGVATGELPGTMRAAVSRVVLDLLELAEHYYASGDAGMRFIPRRPRLAILAASRVYRAIGRKIRRRHARHVLDRRTWVSTPGKLAWLAVAMARWLPPAGWFGRPAHDVTLHAHLAGLPGCVATEA